MPGLLYGFCALIIAQSAGSGNALAAADSFALAGLLSLGWIAVAWTDTRRGWTSSLLQVMAAVLCFVYMTTQWAWIAGSVGFAGPAAQPLLTFVVAVFYVLLPLSMTVAAPIRNTIEVRNAPVDRS